MRIRVAALHEFASRSARKFAFVRGGEPETGFVANHDGKLVAYVNRCRHLPWPLDWDDGAFYTGNREYFLCHTHGALYEPASGQCVAGPCAGASLEALAVAVDGDDVYVETEPEPDPGTTT